jgi:hypothetical protein
MQQQQQQQKLHVSTAIKDGIIIIMLPVKP